MHLSEFGGSYVHLSPPCHRIRRSTWREITFLFSGVPSDRHACGESWRVVAVVACRIGVYHDSRGCPQGDPHCTRSRSLEYCSFGPGPDGPGPDFNVMLLATLHGLLPHSDILLGFLAIFGARSGKCRRMYCTAFFLALSKHGRRSGALPYLETSV